MFYRLSRRAFITTTATVLVGAATAGAISLRPFQAASAMSASPSWMTTLSDNTKISRLTIPGTHDTCSLYGGAITACQTMSLIDQLNAGIRFIDIRCRHIDNVFAIHHGSVFQNLYFGAGVRDVCINFLTAHPGECIVMSVKEEYNPTGNTRTFEDTFDSYSYGFENYWYFGDSVPTLGDVRGKIVLLRRFSATHLPVGIDASGWVDNATFEIKNATTLEVQDQYNIPTLLPVSINGKWSHIQALLDRAQADASDTWYINFSSGASLFAYPNAVADRINPKLLQYVSSSFPNRLGMFPMDFPDGSTITRMIGLNG